MSYRIDNLGSGFVYMAPGQPLISNYQIFNKTLSAAKDAYVKAGSPLAQVTGADNEEKVKLYDGTGPFAGFVEHSSAIEAWFDGWQINVLREVKKMFIETSQAFTLSGTEYQSLYIKPDRTYSTNEANDVFVGKVVGNSIATNDTMVFLTPIEINL